MTHDLVERMVGHRTRLAQQAPERWHQGEDQALDRYLNLSKEVDQTGVLLLALVPQAWLLIGVLGLTPAFVSGSGSPTTLAVGIGGILLAHQALKRLAMGLQHLTGACISWKQVAPLFRAAGRSQGEQTITSASIGVTTAPGQHNKNSAFFETHDLTFRYPQGSEPVLRGCDLRIALGDRLLLEGSSGGGKSTLASLLMGLRPPQSGLLLAGGLDRRTLGTEGWRKLVSAAPQFHENHVLTGTFSFNLLMGRCWPPRPEDLEEAESICRQLGLDDLLKSMPAGLLQVVGETGWQLSHGERSRLYIARALLQGSDLVVLDESFASLDAENLQRALSCVLDRAPTLLVIAHP
jgi:ATP-binding cassette, subfamily B, bacterial